MAEQDETGEGDGQGEGFVARWARRKQDARTAARPASAESPAPGPESAESAGPPAALDPAELPDPDTLDAEADFTVFLKEGVPEAIRRRALRRLWRLNPVLANLDGLNDYDDDFTDAATVVAGLKTLYKVGQGMASEEKETPGETPETAEAAPPDDPPASEAAEEQAEEPGAPEPEPEPDETPVAARARPTSEPGPAPPAPSARRRGALERRWGGPKT